MYLRSLCLLLVWAGPLLGQANFVPSTGDVGIGTSTPAGALHIQRSKTLVMGEGAYTAVIEKIDIGDMVIPLGLYRMGAQIEVDLRIEGGWSESGGHYSIMGWWNRLPLVTSRNECSDLSSRVSFSAYLDPRSNGTFGFLYLNWINLTPSKANPNTLRIKVSSNAAINLTDLGSHASAQLIPSFMTLQSGLDGKGYLGLGTLNPSHPLTVNGAIRAKEIIVESGWADHVFKPGYALAPLGEVEKYIELNGRLPNVPSATDVQATGQSLGETQVLLLEKIEELTLHLIRQEKQLAAQKEEIDELRRVVSSNK